MDIDVLGDDDEPSREEKVEKNLKETEDHNLEKDAEISSMADYIDDQISQALTTGRMEAETRGEGNDDLVVKALMVNTALTLAIGGMMAYQWYF